MAIITDTRNGISRTEYTISEQDLLDFVKLSDKVRYLTKARERLIKKIQQAWNDGSWNPNWAVVFKIKETEQKDAIDYERAILDLYGPEALSRIQKLYAQKRAPRRTIEVTDLR